MGLTKKQAAGWISDLASGRRVLPLRRSSGNLDTFEVVDEWKIGTSHTFKVQACAYGCRHTGPVFVMNVDGSELSSFYRDQ